MKKLLILSLGVWCSSMSFAQQPQEAWFVKKDGSWTYYNQVDSMNFNNTFAYVYSQGEKFYAMNSGWTKLYLEHPEKQVYTPSEYSANKGFENDANTWSYARSKSSDNFICFWQRGFGDDPAKAPALNGTSMTVNVDELLRKAEMFRKKYVELGFMVPEESQTDHYKMMIMLFYQTEWKAEGAGLDDKIGVLWLNPWAANAAGGHTLAHEVGHSFQYQTACDYQNGCGFRYGFGPNASGGCAFWESCAQWQGFKVYPEQQFTDGRFGNYCDMTYYNPLHETPRYDFYFDQDYLCYVNGTDFVGRLWRGARKPEDPIEAYKRLTGIDQETFNDQMYDRAARFVTWDIPSLRERGAQYIGRQHCNMHEAGDGYWAVDSTYCPQNYGYNIIRLNCPEAGTTVQASFVGEAGATGYRAVNVDKAGWRYGFVALSADGTRTYSPMQKDVVGTASLTLPEGAQKLWLVVSGAPSEHWRHPWDDDASNDEQWPYKVRLEGTDLYGHYDFPAGYQGTDVTLTYDVDLNYSTTGYDGVNVCFADDDLDKVCSALGLDVDGLKCQLGSRLNVVGIQPTGGIYTTNTVTTGDGGHWFNATGQVTNYGSAACIYAEYNKSSLTFKVGQYPGRLTRGNNYTVKEGLRYRATDGKYHLVTFVFNVHVK